MAVRVAFLGNDRWSAPSLRALAATDDIEVGLVVTREPRPAGRGNRLARTPVAMVADALGLPLAEVTTVRVGEGRGALEASRPDVLAVVAYGELLPPDVLGLPAIAPVNVHFSLLPALRGASPVQHALLRGLRVTGVTTMRIDAGLDTGPILLRREVPVRDDDDAGSLGDRLASIGGELLVETVRGLVAGTVSGTPQPSEGVSVAPKLGARDRVLDWSRPAEDLRRRVRALSPRPGASTTFRGRPLKVFRVEVVGGAGAPGAILGVDRAGIVVGTGDAGLRLLEVAPAGGRRMEAAAFARGRRPVPGELLG
jgi:methionyl-tRNA formyltransferase